MYGETRDPRTENSHAHMHTHTCCILFALCLLLLTWSIAGIACRACHSSGTFFSLWHTQAHTHTRCLIWTSSTVECIWSLTYHLRPSHFLILKLWSWSLFNEQNNIKERGEEWELSIWGCVMIIFHKRLLFCLTFFPYGILSIQHPCKPAS